VGFRAAAVGGALAFMKMASEGWTLGYWEFFLSESQKSKKSDVSALWAKLKAR
jgi:hypothetical protein